VSTRHCQSQLQSARNSVRVQPTCNKSIYVANLKLSTPLKIPATGGGALHNKECMEKSIYSKRLATLRQHLKKTSMGDCDTVWIICPENRRYLSGFKAEDPQFTESSGSLLINNARSSDPKTGVGRGSARSDTGYGNKKARF